MGKRRTIQATEPGAASALLDPAAKEKLQRAAESVGLSVEQLIDLAYHSGAVDPELSLPSGKVTVDELGKRMWGELQKVSKPARTEWFGNLEEAQRTALIITLSDRGYRPEVISLELGVPSIKVREIANAYSDKIGFQVTQMRLSTIAGNLQLAAERAMEGLLGKEDYKGYFDVQKKMIELLQSMGIVDQAIQRIEVTQRTEQSQTQVQEDINAMIDIERKKQARLLELERAGRVQIDEVPELEFEKEQ